MLPGAASGGAMFILLLSRKSVSAFCFSSGCASNTTGLRGGEASPKWFGL